MTRDDDRDEAGASPGGEERPDPAEAIAAEYADRLIAGERIDAEEILSKHPALGPEILDHLEVFVGLGRPAAGAAPRTLGDYTLRRQIGRGGMGVVYEAWQGSMDRVVALKVLPPGVAADSKAFVRFLREAKTAGQLSHPNVVAVYSTGVEEGTPWYSMEYVEGETLAQILRKMRAAAPEAPTPFGASREELAFYSFAARAFADVADGLQHAHSRGVVHRDIKPSNLILDAGLASPAAGGSGARGADSVPSAGAASAAPRLRILDFGLARLEGQESLSASGDVVGTPLYMSPEQARRKKVPVDHRTDVYSLGATLYEVLTLEPPFRGKDHEDTLSQIIQREPRPPRQSSPRVPRDLETIVLKCLRKEPGERYGTAEALGQDLRRFVRGDPIEAREQSAWEKVAHRLWRRRRSLLGVASMIVLSLVGLSLSTFLVAGAYRSVREERDVRTRELYRANMRLAMQDWEAGNYLRFTELIDRHVPGPGEPDLRGWEWHYLESLRRTEEHVKIHVDPRGVQSVSWSPGGVQVASGSADGVLRIWDAPSGKLVLELAGDPSPVRAIAYAPDGRRIAAVSQEGWVRAWDLTSGERLFEDPPDSELPPGDEQRAIVWSPDGSVVVSGEGRRGVHVRDAGTGAILTSLSRTEADCIPCMSWSPQGDRLAIVLRAPAEVVVWNTATWEEAYRIATRHPLLYSAAWSPDGSQIATASADHWIRIWSTETRQEETRFLAHSGSVFCLEWGADGLASTGADGTVKVWAAGAWSERRRLLGHTDMVWWLDWSPDGSRIASAGQDGALRVWNVSTEDLAPSGADVKTAVWSRDGRRLATQADRTGALRLLDVESWKTLRVLDVRSDTWICEFSPDGRLLAAIRPGASGDAVVTWDWERGVEVPRLEGPHGGTVLIVTWSPDGALVATVGKDDVIRIWDAACWEPTAELRGHEAPVKAAVWSPDGRRLATTSEDLVLKVWDRATWTPVRDLRRGDRLTKALYETDSHAIAWSPDGKLLAATFLTAICWDVESGREVFRVSGHVSGLSSVEWSPDGKRLATGGFDRTVKIWDVSDVEEPVELFALRGHEWIVHTLSWNPKGWMLLSHDIRDGLRIWDASPAEETKRP